MRSEIGKFALTRHPQASSKEEETETDLKLTGEFPSHHLCVRERKLSPPRAGGIYKHKQVCPVKRQPEARTCTHCPRSEGRWCPTSAIQKPHLTPWETGGFFGRGLSAMTPEAHQPEIYLGPEESYRNQWILPLLFPCFPPRWNCDPYHKLAGKLCPFPSPRPSYSGLNADPMNCQLEEIASFPDSRMPMPVPTSELACGLEFLLPAPPSRQTMPKCQA